MQWAVGYDEVESIVLDELRNAVYITNNNG
jgi:hypothetical protein